MTQQKSHNTGRFGPTFFSCYKDGNKYQLVCAINVHIYNIVVSTFIACTSQHSFCVCNSCMRQVLRLKHLFYYAINAQLTSQTHTVQQPRNEANSTVTSKWQLLCWLPCKWNIEFSDTNVRSTFRLNASVIIRVKAFSRSIQSKRQQRTLFSSITTIDAVDKRKNRQNTTTVQTPRSLDASTSRLHPHSK